MPFYETGSHQTAQASFELAMLHLPGSWYYRCVSLGQALVSRFYLNRWMDLIHESLCSRAHASRLTNGLWYSDQRVGDAQKTLQLEPFK